MISTLRGGVSRNVVHRSWIARYMSNFKTLGDDSAYRTLADASGKQVHYFTATWCPPCRKIGPIFEKEMAPEFPGIEFVKIDVDQCGDAAAENSITGVPTFQFRNGGKVVDQFVGASPDDILQRLKTLASA